MRYRGWEEVYCGEHRHDSKDTLMMAMTLGLYAIGGDSEPYESEWEHPNADEPIIGYGWTEEEAHDNAIQLIDEYWG